MPAAHAKDAKRGKRVEVTPRALTSQLFLNLFTGDKPDVTIMRVEAHKGGRVASFTVVGLLIDYALGTLPGFTVGL